jgi:putative flippase GtrA
MTWTPLFGLRTQLWELLRYGMKGGSTMVLNIAMMAALVEVGGVPPQWAAIASTAAVICVGYVLMHYFVFPGAAEGGHARRGPAYVAVIASGKLANYVLFLVLLSVVPYPVAWVLGAGVVFLGLYAVNRWLWHGEVFA